MAIYHLSAKIIGRGAGHSALACAAYRSGSKLVDPVTGATYRSGRASSAAHTEIIAPDGAPTWAHDQATLWRSVEDAERRKDAQLAREFEISLPRELTDAQQLALVRQFVRDDLSTHGLVADLSIHRDRARNNPHVHIMTSLRRLGPDGWSKDKSRHLNSDAQLVAWRATCAHHANRALAAAGHEARIDYTSLDLQQADLPPELRAEPTRKLGLRGSRVNGDRAAYNRGVRARNAERARTLRALAENADPAMPD